MTRPANQALVSLATLPVLHVQNVHIDKPVAPVGAQVGTGTNADKTTPGLDKMKDLLFAGASQTGYKGGGEAVSRDA